MTDTEQIEAFRKALMQQAYEDFLAWARNKVEFYEEYNKTDFSMNFDDWVRCEYRGEIE